MTILLRENNASEQTNRSDRQEQNSIKQRIHHRQGWLLMKCIRLTVKGVLTYVTIILTFYQNRQNIDVR